MPVQRLDQLPAKPSRADKRLTVDVLLGRVLVFGLAGALTALGTFEVYQVVSVSGLTVLQMFFAGLFAITFAWIAFACANAVLGFIHLACRSPLLDTPPANGPLGRNALIMPIYEEDPDRVALSLEGMARELAAAGAASSFDIFVLSDTRDAARAAVERNRIAALRCRLAGLMPVYYRRRLHNRQRKAGNIADFVTRFGFAYDHMIVLDADSYMTGEALVRLARAMAADPGAGIIQTLPLLRGRNTLFARLLQFAARIYGPVIAAGLAAWHGRDGNYYGHNAIIRVRAFAATAGLPELPGRQPFGGPILSHDFVEAALMRRAGWAVYMLPGLPGSYEESPPTLIDLARRDRRWAQGNLQHVAVLPAKGLCWVSRVHLLQGIMSYLTSPLWLLLIGAGLLLSLQAQFATPEYFPEGFVLFPQWPVFDPERALRLLGLTMAVLFLPKVLGLALALMDRNLREGCGGGRRILAGVAAETLLSALIAPVLMLIQTRFVLDVLCGRDSGWSAQNRDDRGHPWRYVVRRHFWHMAAGIGLGGAAAAVSLDTLLWLSPLVAGLVFSAPVSWLTAQPWMGTAARRLGLFVIPEERATIAAEPEQRASPVLQAGE